MRVIFGVWSCRHRTTETDMRRIATIICLLIVSAIPAIAQTRAAIVPTASTSTAMVLHLSS